MGSKETVFKDGFSGTILYQENYDQENKDHGEYIYWGAVLNDQSNECYRLIFSMNKAFSVPLKALRKHTQYITDRIHEALKTVK
jgi:hypothetical protein